MEETIQQNQLNNSLNESLPKTTWGVALRAWWWWSWRIGISMAGATILLGLLMALAGIDIDKLTNTRWLSYIINLVVYALLQFYLFKRLLGIKFKKFSIVVKETGPNVSQATDGGVSWIIARRVWWWYFWRQMVVVIIFSVVGRIMPPLLEASWGFILMSFSVIFLIFLMKTLLNRNFGEFLVLVEHKP